jgi:hypothetical protein
MASTISAGVARPVARSAQQGSQTPRIWHVPPFVSSTGEEVIELAQMAGLLLDPWQEFVLAESLGEKSDGSWAAFEVGLAAPRQNGKNALLEARELAGLFLLGEQLIIHSAHQFDTSVEQFRRLLYLIENTPEFDRRVDKISRAHGAEGITLLKDRRTGVQQRITFRTRTRGGGRGFSGDCLIMDEAMILPESAYGALLPTLSARPNPQIWFTGSAVDQQVHEDGIVFARVRERGIAGDPSLAYFEFSAEGEEPESLTHEELDDEELWAQANPGLGIRISSEHIAKERRSMDRRTFAVERLGVGDWPRTDGLSGVVITPQAWAELSDLSSAAQDPVCFCIEVSPDRARAAIGVAGARSDGLTHLEVVDHRRGTGWLVDRAKQLDDTHQPIGFVVDGGGPAGSLIPELERAGVKVIPVNAKEYTQACGMLYDAVEQSEVRHLGTQELSSAVAGAVKRQLGEAWAWSRKNSSIDISPLVAITLAFFGLRIGSETSTINIADYRITQL